MTNDIVVYDETTEVTLEQLVTYCHVRREKVVELVREGILAPHGAAPAGPSVRPPACRHWARAA